MHNKWHHPKLDLGSWVVGGKLSKGHLLPDDEDDGAIKDFFGQPWWVPQSPPPRVNQHPSTLFWIHRDL
jgi:hypothetical protein